MKWQGQTLVKQAVGFTYSPMEGYSFMPRHQGTPQAILGVARNYKLNRIPFEYRNDDGVATLQAEHQLPDGAAETPNGSWALVGQPETVDWRQHDTYLALTDDEREFIKQRIDDKLDYSPSEAISGVVWDFYTRQDGVTVGTTFKLTDPSNALTLYRMACNGQYHFERIVWTLRHTMTVSQSYTANLVGDNIDRVYTTAQLLAECASFADPLPPRYITQVNAIDFNPAVPTGYIKGWLKRMANDETVAGDRCQASVEYVLQLWPTIFYPAKS